MLRAKIQSALLIFILSVSCSTAQTKSIDYYNYSGAGIEVSTDFIRWYRYNNMFPPQEPYNCIGKYISKDMVLYRDVEVPYLQLLNISTYKMDLNSQEYDPLSFKNIQNLIEIGTLSKGHKDFYYCIFPSRNSSGYIFLNKVVAAKVGSDNNLLLWVMYSEDISYRKDFRYYFEDWQDRNKFTNEQQLRLKEFKVNYSKSYTIYN